MSSRGTKRRSSRGGLKDKPKKQKTTCWQPTLNRYFGGKPVLVQPTLGFFLKKQKSNNKKDTHPIFEHSQNENKPSIEETVNNDELCLPPLEEKSEEDPSLCKPVKKEPLEEKSTISHTGSKKLSPHLSENTAHSKPKLLSLKVRKRKYRVTGVSPPSEQSSKKPCTTNSLDAGKSSEALSQSIIDGNNYGAVNKCTTSFSSEDEEMLLGYTNNPVPAKKLSLADLEHFEELKENNRLETERNQGSGTCYNDEQQCTSRRTQLHRTTIDKAFTRNVSLSPAFSPRKPTPTSFTHILEERGIDRHGSSEEDLNTSVPLFTTPTCSGSKTAGPLCTQRSCSQSVKETPKRTLFGKGENETMASCPSVSKQPCTSQNDFSFGDDFDISELVEDHLMEGSCDYKMRSCDLNRYLVLEATTQECVDQNSMLNHTNRSKSEMVLRLLDEKTKSEKMCFLRDDWLNLNVNPGDTVQVNSKLDSSVNGYVVDNTQEDSSIVVNPDLLISGTSVANSITCVRRAVLAERFKGCSSGSEAMTMGKMLHEVFQRVLLKRQEVGVTLGGVALREVVTEEIQNVVATMDSLEQLYSLDMSEVVAIETLSEHIPAVVEWCEKFMHQEAVQGRGEIEFKNASSTSSCIAVSEVQDIEENIWSPRFGLKGKVDVTVRLKEKREGAAGVELSRVPLELKTGKMFRKQGSIEHRAQLTLYTLMLSDRYSTQPPGGLLFYLKTGHMQGLPSLPHERRGLLLARNHLAQYHSNLGGHVTLPGMLKDRHTCKHCPYIKQCMLYHKTLESGDERSSGIGELFSEQVSHLPLSHREFFAKWYKLVAEEETVSKRSTGPPIWLTTAQQRENDGHCFASMLARPAVTSNLHGKVVQTFVKQQGSTLPSERTLSINEQVIVSHQDGSGWAVALGTITNVSVSTGEVELTVMDRPVPHGDNVLYRIDHASGYSGGAMASNLAQFCSSDSERDHHLRELIIDHKPPRFTAHTNSQLSLPQNLNSCQKAAISMVLSSKDYSLILGMPGTGKTTTIACLVQVLVDQGRSVLLTSYTHSAVDNILLKLKENGVDFLRLGKPSRVHPSLYEHTPTHLCNDTKTVKALETVYESKAVVATTCLGVNHSLFTRRLFDVCIVDEASQITLPVCLGPLRYACVFVLVGDHYQLPPLVQSQQAREGGLDVSLFRYLSEHHSNALVALREQYRMNREIMSLSNALIYNNRLHCGNEDIATGTLRLPNPSHLHTLTTTHNSKRWLSMVIDPQVPVLFVNTDKCPAAIESSTGDQLYNSFEAAIVKEVVINLIQCGLPAEDIGVITPLRHQQNLIQEKLQSSTTSPSLSHVLRGHCCNVEVNTVDKYQGRDKECIIVSFVRSNSKGNTGSLLRDWRRINVALTRAKHKLLLIGSSNTLRHAPLLECLMSMLESRQQVFHLPPDVGIFSE